MRYRREDLGDWITEDTPTLLAAFGEGAVERLKEYILDGTLDRYIRISVATALNVIAHQHPSTKENIKAFLSKLIEDTSDSIFAAFLVDELLSFKDQNLLLQIDIEFEKGKIDTEVIRQDDMDWVFNLPEEEQSYSKFMKSPLEHFSKENIDYLREISYPETKTTKKSEVLAEKYEDTLRYKFKK